MTIIDRAFDETPTISIITQIELLCWNTDVITSNKVKDFIEDSSILNITSDIISQCVRLRKEKKIKTPDAIIAATALSNNFTLIPTMKRILQVSKT